MITSQDEIQIVKQTRILNAYLDNPTAIVVKLSDPVTLPIVLSDVTVTDTATGQMLPIVSVDIVHPTAPRLVGDMQHLLGGDGDWNTTDKSMLMNQVNSNLYQFNCFLPAGTYHYKIIFNGVWNGAIPGEPIEVKVPEGGASVTFSYVLYDFKTGKYGIYDSLTHPDEILPTSTDGMLTDLVAVTLVEPPDVSHGLIVALKNFEQINVIPRNVLSDSRYIYMGDDLGNLYRPDATTFRVWAPTASDVQLLLYQTETGPLERQVAMQRSEGGTWYTEVPGDLKHWYYLYQVTVHGNIQTAVDPYVKAIATNATRGMILDLRNTDPTGWQEDSALVFFYPEDAVIYEVHVRDFSIHPDSGMQHKGKYLAFTERGTKGPERVLTGIDSLKELGITHVQLQPVQEFASVDETDPNQYNWGYDPRNYNVPEGAYATTPHGLARISEFKQLVQSLHREQIGVVMDVVYNHTFAKYDSDFDKLVPQYYYRTNDYGNYTNGSGVHNELATERPMVQKFMRDSLKFWTREYHIDGFRFDLMALHGTETMKKVRADLSAIHPYIFLYGEPWTGGATGLTADNLLVKGEQRGLGISVFNDTIRNSLCGSVFDVASKGFATGAQRLVENIKRVVEGSINDFAASPGESINYVTSHDNYTLWDKISLSNTAESEADRIQMDKLAQAVIFTAQGVPFFQGGEEFLRTKSGNDNSYNAGDFINQFDWARKANYLDVFHYYAGLIHLRKHHPAFRMRFASDVREHLKFIGSPHNTLAFELSDHANGDSWKRIIVIYNPNKANIRYSLPHGSWTIVVNHQWAGDKPLGHAKGTVIVPGISCMVLHQ